MVAPGDDGGTVPLAELLHRGDLDGLVREVDRRANLGDWEGVLLVRDRCHAATEELGKQLWAAAQYAEYRTALAAPADVAAEVVQPGAARFALGPLTEVVAQDHEWEELADRLHPAVAAVVATERVLRGEDVTGDPRAALDDVGLPGRLQPWEPRYPLPTYRPAERIEGTPAPARARPIDVDPRPGAPRARAGLERALLAVVEPWETESTGDVHVAVVDGDAGAAAAALLPDRLRLTSLELPEAMSRLAWAAGTGGAHGRRRGMASGRSAAWWVAHAATGLEFPPDADELEFHLEDLRWYEFDDGAPPTSGWRLQLAVEDPGAGWAAAVDARDVAPDDEADGGPG